MASSTVVFPLFILIDAAIWYYYRIHINNPATHNQLLAVIFLQPFIMYAGVRFSGIYNIKNRNCCSKIKNYLVYYFIINFTKCIII